MPKRGDADETVDVYVRVSAAHAELLADLRAIPARARAGRLRLLATLALRPSGPSGAGVFPPPAPAAAPHSLVEAPASAPVTTPVTPQRQRVNQIKNRLLP